MAEPLQWQREGIDKVVGILKEHSAALEASGTGYGKTYVAAFAAKQLGLRAAVVCPKSVIPAWVRTLEDVGVDYYFVTNYEMLRSTKHERYGGWKIKNRKYEWRIPRDCVLVFDEVHRCKNYKSQNAKFLRAAREWGGKVLMMSATVAESPEHMSAIGYALKLFQEPTHYLSWAWQYGFRKSGFAFEFMGGAAELQAMHAAIFPDKGHRVRVEDIHGFPENRVEVVAVPVDNVALYDELMAKLAELEEKRDRDGFTAEGMTELLRSRQEAELLKAPAMADMAIDLVEAGHSVPIFVNFRGTHELIKQRVHAAGIKFAEIIGGQDTVQRQLEIDSFQSDRARVMVSMIQAGGVGIDLHDTHGHHSRVSLISPGFAAVELKQALGRSCRAGGKTKTIQRICFAADTIEEKIRWAVKNKLDRMDTINDGDLAPPR